MLEPVPHTPEFDRVFKLPRRQWSWEMGEDLARRLTPLLRTQQGEAEGVQLLPLQGLVLNDAFSAKGGVFAMPVGEGKTLTSYELPLVLQARRPIYFAPANSLEERASDFAQLGRRWLTSRPPARLESYNALSNAKNWDLLLKYKPDLIIADEADCLRNTDSGVTMRFAEWFEANPDCMFVALTGTLLRKSIKNFAHLIKWALKGDAPIPLRWLDLEMWSNALDEKVETIKRMRPGALLKFATAEDITPNNDLDTARKGFRRRLAETQGIIFVDKQSCDQPIHIRLLQAPEDPILDDAFRKFRDLMLMPDGFELTGPLEMFQKGNELGCGFYHIWDPRPPEAWLDARRAWGKFQLSKIGTRDPRNGRLIATELMVANAYPNESTHLAWREIEKTFKPNPVPRWLTGSVIGYARDWMQANGPAIVWTQHTPVGEALSRISGAPFFGPGGISNQGDSIVTYRGNKSIICSLHSNKRGRNLQDRYNLNLSIGWPQPATDVEQMIGRTHRQNQKKPVHFDVLMGCAEHIYALDMSYREAGFVKIQQGQTQKILIANCDSSMLRHNLTKRWYKDSMG